MKKLSVIILSLILVFSFAACGNDASSYASSSGLKKEDYGTYKIIALKGAYWESRYDENTLKIALDVVKIDDRLGVWYLGEESYYEVLSTKVFVSVQKDGTIDGATEDDIKALNNLFDSRYTVEFKDGIITVYSFMEGEESILQYGKED